MQKNIIFDLWGTLAYLEGQKDIAKEIAQICGIDKRKYQSIVEQVWYKNQMSPEEFSDLLINKFKLTNCNKTKLVKSLLFPLNSAKLYRDTIPVITKLKEFYSTFLVSDTSSIGKQAAQDLGLFNYFDNLFFSCDIGVTKKEGLYNLVLSKNNETPSNFIVVGNSFDSDFKIPISLGARAILIDRNGMNKNSNIIQNLEELICILQ